MFKIQRLSFALLLASSAMIMEVQAGQNTTANTVKGRAPVASAVSVANLHRPGMPLMPGDWMDLNYTYSDADLDAENATTFRYLDPANGVVGSTDHSQVTVAHVGIPIRGAVTPGSVTSADPYVGAEVIASAVTPLLDISRWIVAGGAAWSAANNHCASIGARLPTSAELQQLFVDATRATAAGQSNSQMCELYGWPLAGQCGGIINYYWSSTPDSASIHYDVDLSNGIASRSGDSAASRVACIR